MLRTLAVWMGCLLCWGGSARAAPPTDEQRIVLMNESVAYMDVIDAADGADRFDISAHVEFSRLVERAKLAREWTTPAGARTRRRFAESRRVRSQLDLGLDVGLYHDLMAFVRLPLTVSDARSLRPAGKAPLGLLVDPSDFGGAESALFSVPFESPTRAGFDHVAFGVAYGLLNQARSPFMPTWVISLEGRRALGKPMSPCRVSAAGGRDCGSVNDEDLDGDDNPDGTAGELAGGRPGVSRGVSALKLGTRLSRRFRYAEPYVGSSLLVEWPSRAARYFRPGGRSQGALQEAPSRRLALDVGSAVIPWEHRGRYQRVAIDMRVSATYLSGGREYSALYDALGTSAHAQLSRPNFEGVIGQPVPGATLSPCATGAAEPCYVGAKVPFYGLTDVGPRLRYGLRLGLELSAARYVRFRFGSDVSFVSAHAITSAWPCNPNVSDPDRSTSRSGGRCVAGVVNPAHRETIDLPGRRFLQQSALTYDIYAAATAQF